MKTFTKTFTIKASTEDVYACFTNRYTIELWSGCATEMPAEEGNEFSMFEGDITGTVVKLIPSRLIEQEWYFGKKNPSSPVRITLTEKGGITEVKIEQSGIPDDDYENISEGWEEQIMEPIASFLNPNF